MFQGFLGHRTKPRSTRFRVAALVTLAAALAAACGAETGGGSPDPEQPTILVTTSIWADVTANVACGGVANIETIVPTGSDPHGFEPSLADRGLMEQADLIVANGLALEEGLDDTLEAVEGSGVPVFRIAEHINSLVEPYPDQDGDTRADDPHVWFDPQRTSAALPELASQIIEHAGLDPQRIEACLASYQIDLAGVDDQVERTLTGIAAGERILVTDHDSLGYFADRYSFDVIGTVIPASSTLAEANPAQLEALATLIERTGVKAIFVEDQHSNDDSDALADRVGGIEVVSLRIGSLGEPGSGADTYLGFLKSNATTIAAALAEQ